ncbi:MAG: hypothetical protein E4G91_11320 [Candidatus Zixiibacteriota bacterium]|nr:MAG: hypothetical protein E4G91_11320 [candidate division Zixibacteria bacterium]
MNIVIYGAPGSGKTTYANEIREDEDVVFDLDAIAATLNPRFANFGDRPNDIAWLILAFREVLIKRHRNGMLGKRRIIVIVKREDQAKGIARTLGAKLVCASNVGSYEVV